MAEPSDVAALYRLVIDKVISSIRSDFTNQGVDEQVLTDLQMTWERKLIEANVFPTTHIHTHPTFPSNLRQTVDMNVNGQGNHNGMTVMYAHGNNGNVRVGQSGRALTASMVAQQQMTNAPGSALLLAQAQISAMRPQVQSGISYFQEPQSTSTTSNDKTQTDSSVEAPSTTPQRTEEAVKKPSKKPKNASNEEELNSDLDSSLSSSTSDPEAPDDLNENIILCLYEKVNRTRNRWRAAFRSGFLHLNGVDYAFNRQNAEFEF